MYKLVHILILFLLFLLMEDIIGEAFVWTMELDMQCYVLSKSNLSYCAFRFNIHDHNLVGLIWWSHHVMIITHWHLRDSKKFLGFFDGG